MKPIVPARRRNWTAHDDVDVVRAVISSTPPSDLFATVSGLIEEARRTLARQANSTTVFLFWRIGRQVNGEILNHQRAEYGQKIVSSLATQLSANYGRSFEARNLRRMMQFAEQFPDFETSAIPLDTFNGPYLLDVLGLHDGYLEADLEAAVLRELESFMLELGGGFTFVIARRGSSRRGDPVRRAGLLRRHTAARKDSCMELACLIHSQISYRNQAGLNSYKLSIKKARSLVG